MKYLITLLFLFTFTLNSHAQIGFGHSVPLWGKTVETAEISIQYNRISVYYFHNYTVHPEPIEVLNYTYLFLYVPEQREPKPVIRTSSVAISYTILDKKYFKFSPTFTLNNFPTPEASKVNFILEIRLPIKDRISINYKHLSNGFGLLNKNNVGYDSFSITFKI